MNQLCDEQKFQKSLGPGLVELRVGIHDGLFTAYNGEENWELGHKFLVPPFGPLNVGRMFDQMKDIAGQLVLKMVRYGPEYKMPVTHDFTRLTMDTIALCAANYRFNSFYTEEVHPFVSHTEGSKQTIS